MEDTIAAISTALGVGAISIIRVSGSYDDLHWLMDYYYRVLDSKDVILEGPITYDPGRDQNGQGYTGR